MIGRRPVRRLGPDRVELRLPGGDADAVCALVTELRATLEDEAPNEVTRRLFPTAYPADPEHDREYQQLVREELQMTRVRAIEAVLGALGRADRKGGTRSVVLADGEALALLGVLNDVRLAIGARLGITDDLDGRVDPADPRAPDLGVLYYLQWLQELLLEAFPV